MAELGLTLKLQFQKIFNPINIMIRISAISLSYQGSNSSVSHFTGKTLSLGNSYKTMHRVKDIGSAEVPHSIQQLCCNAFSSV